MGLSQNLSQTGNQMGCLTLKSLKMLAGTTGLEPATSCVTGMRSNQLNYVPTCSCSCLVASGWGKEHLASH